jgi:ATP-dependent RNA helicase RhlE
VGQEAQVRAISHGIDILIATPGCLPDIMNQGFIKLKGVGIFVLDEIDKLLDMGFINDMRRSSQPNSSNRSSSLLPSPES